MFALTKIVFCVVSILAINFSFVFQRPISADNLVNFENKKVSFEINFAGKTQLITGFLSKPMKGVGPYPAVILLHGCTGLDLDGYSMPWKGLVNHARFLSKHNFVSLIVDSHGSRGITTQASWVDSCVYGKGYFERTADVNGAITYLEKLKYVDTNKIVLMGQSQGAMVVLNALRSDSHVQSNYVAAGIAYYPHCGYLKNMFSIPNYKKYFNSPILIIIGSQDNITPARYCRELIEVMQDRPNGFKNMPELLEYEGVQHSFDLPLWSSSITPIGTIAPDQKATDDSRAKYILFMKKHFD